jgi:signal transduction histidine kinase
MMVLSLSGKVLAHNDAATVGQFVSDEASMAFLKSQPVNRVITDDESLSDVAVPIMVDHRHVGWVRVAQGRAKIAGNLHKMMLSSILFVLIALILSLFSALFIANRLGHRIGYLMQVAEAVQAGNYVTRANISGDDEIARLAHSLNHMLDVLAQEEEKLRQLNAKLEQRVAQRTAQLESLNKDLEEFSYSMSHDMRTPLRALDGFSKILDDEYGPSLDDEGKRLLKVLRDNAQRMGRLVDDILHFLSIGRQKMEHNSVDIAKLVWEVFTELQAATPARSLHLEIATLPPAWGDPDMIREVLQNLLSNAVKFSRETEEVVIELGGIAGEVENVYSVTDHGVGFDMRYAEKLFKVFERVHPTGQYAGSGIGLALVKRIVTRHGGRVWAEGKLNEGATIYFALPKSDAWQYNAMVTSI